MSTFLRVMVEVRSELTHVNVAELDLPGFVVNSMVDPTSFRHSDDAWGERGFVIRGFVRQDFLAKLRRHADVLDVYLDTDKSSAPPVVPFPVSDDQIGAWPLKNSIR